jgi:hypothetical protein
MKTSLTFAFCTLLCALSARGGPVQSISRLAFGPDHVLFLADWKAGQIVALDLPAASALKAEPFNLTNFDEILSKAVGGSDFRVEDMKARPGTGEVYVALSAGHDGRPMLVSVTSDGSAKTLDLAANSGKSLPLKDAPDSGYEFWDKTPERSFTVTDMKWHEGKLYIAGLSNQEFASTLRIVPYPFSGSQRMVSVEIYHTSHDQIETRAPIRQMTFVTLGGKQYLLAAYLCTPLVTIPLDSMQDGAHVRGKTIAELGYGNTPDGIVTFDVTWQGATTTYALVSNVERNAELIPLTQIAAANEKPGLMKQVNFGEIAGLSPIQAPLAGVYRIDNLNSQFLIALRRDLATGHSQLLTFDKSFRFRISDFISEYNFPGYKYQGQVQVGFIKPVEDALKKEEGYPVTSSPMPNGPFPYKGKQ